MLELLRMTVPLFLLAFGIRVGMLLYGVWQDSTMVVKYTDIDYMVFSEAAEFVVHGGSPYERSTYRYTPLLSWAMIPNILLHNSFGKWIFIITDILIALSLRRILIKLLSKISSGSLRSWPAWDHQLLCNFLVFIWLFNPIAMNVSSRGNAEALISLMVVVSLDFLFSHQYIAAALMYVKFISGERVLSIENSYGLSVHFKVYPLIFAPALFMFIDSEDDNKKGWIPFGIKALKFTRNRVVFTLVSAGTFLLLTAAMYHLYGFEFLWETYLYHVVRKDHRHNFSPYFYQIYLSTADASTGSSSIIALLAFLPQIILLLVIAFVYSKDIGFCIFAQTFTFVIFNKVCTVQYFIWYFSLLPLAMVHTKLSIQKAASMILLWFLSQGAWLYYAYHLEFLGQNTFFEIWAAGVIFFVVNIWILLEFIWNHNSHIERKKLK